MKKALNLNLWSILWPFAVCILGCSGELPGDDRHDSEIGLEGFAEDEEKGVTTTYDIPAFRVSAFRNNQWGAATLMDNVVVTRTGLNSWIYSPPVEWPEDESVDFFAVSPSSVTIQNNQWWFHTFRYDNYRADTDLLVSVSLGNHQTGSRIKLNFRHALARVQICLKCSDKSESVNVSGVELCNISDSGTFFFPVENTTPDTNRGEIFSCWRTYNSQADLTVFRPDDGSSIMLGDQPIAVGPDNIFVIPDSLTAMNPDIIWEGSHILVEYSIDGTQATDRFPIREATPGHCWLPGQSYRYTIDLARSKTRADDPEASEISCQTFTLNR